MPRQPTHALYPHLFEPLTVGRLRLPNRILMGSMHLGLEEATDGFRRMAAFYAERARAGVGLIVTGGVAPNAEGRVMADGATLSTRADAEQHRVIAEAVHAEGGHVVVQLLHAGRYGRHPELVAPSALQAPINRFVPRELTEDDIERTLDDFAYAAELALSVGYDGVEVMGSEGYLINQFTAPCTNQRTDRWGGSAVARTRFPVAVVERIRQRVGRDATVSFRISLQDLVPGGSTAQEAVELGRLLERAGVDLLNTGIGWHEARVPTIAASVPRAAFTAAAARLRAAVSVPVVASNRINTPDVAEGVLARGEADLVSLARPLLADPLFVEKARAGASHRINTCIGCNQACIDHALVGLTVSCLVNPRAGHETELMTPPAMRPKRLGVVGAGMAGLSFALTAASRGHEVVVFDGADNIGGLFDLAQRIPGKEEFAETLRYLRHELLHSTVELRLGRRVKSADLLAAGLDEVILATGVTPRRPDIPGIDHPSVVAYDDVIRGRAVVGDRVAIIGAGGIGFDVAELLSDPGSPADSDHASEFSARWGIAEDPDAPGSLAAPVPRTSRRTTYLLQRKDAKLGAGLGVTTGWIHRAELAQRGVRMLSGVGYVRIDDAGLHITRQGHDERLDVDTIVVCAGQESCRELQGDLEAAGLPTHLIGGAELATEIDAKRAVRAGAELGATI